MDDHSMEIKKGERFEFGKNWSRFIRTTIHQLLVFFSKCITVRH